MRKAIVTGAAVLITTFGGATAVGAAAALPAAASPGCGITIHVKNNTNSAIKVQWDKSDSRQAPHGSGLVEEARLGQHHDPGLRHRVQGVHARLLMQHKAPVPGALHPGKQLRVRLLPGHELLDNQVQLHRQGEVMLPPGWLYGAVLAASVTGHRR
jgi:hypothetical protein